MFSDYLYKPHLKSEQGGTHNTLKNCPKKDMNNTNNKKKMR